MDLRRWLGVCSAVAVAVAGCDEPTDVGPRATGQVALYDELGQLLPNADLVEVSALSFSSIRRYVTFTDESGRFDIELPDHGPVPLMFSRDGFGDMYRFDVDGETEALQVRLAARSSAAVTAATAVAESCGTVNCLRLALDVDDFFRAGTTRRIFRLYLSTDPDVSFWEYQVSDLLVVPNDQPGLVQSGEAAGFELGGLHGLLDSFTTGTTVHLVVHGATENLAFSYVSPDDGLEVFTDISEVSAAASFVIP